VKVYRFKAARLMDLFKKVLAFLIVLLAIVVLWPLWPSEHYRELSLFASIRLLLILAALYGTLAFADFIRDRWNKGML
jgi:uncharacterized membrane protein YqjE